MAKGGSTNKNGGSMLSELAVPGGLLVLNQLLKKRNNQNKTKKSRRGKKRTLKPRKSRAKPRKSKGSKKSKRR